MAIDFFGTSAQRAAFPHAEGPLNSTIGKTFYDTQTDLLYISDGVAFDGGHTLGSAVLRWWRKRIWHTARQGTYMGREHGSEHAEESWLRQLHHQRIVH